MDGRLARVRFVHNNSVRAMLELNDLLIKARIDPEVVVVQRHRPTAPELREQLPWMAAEQPELYNAFQSSHTVNVEAMLKQAKHVVSLIGNRPGEALFVGVFDIVGFRTISSTEFGRMKANQTLLRYGTAGPRDERDSLWFDLRLSAVLSELKGRLVLRWPPPERSWSRWASNGTFAIKSIHEESRLVSEMPPWHQLVLQYESLRALPSSWRDRLSQWRGVYYVFDTTLNKGYVGSAYGRDNILGRWEAYGATGHGGNQLLRRCSPEALRFSVLQLVGPDMDRDEVIAVECDWKQRLHTRAPHGLNAN